MEFAAISLVDLMMGWVAGTIVTVIVFSVMIGWLCSWEPQDVSPEEIEHTALLFWTSYCNTVPRHAAAWHQLDWRERSAFREAARIMLSEHRRRRPPQRETP